MAELLDTTKAKGINHICYPLGLDCTSIGLDKYLCILLLISGKRILGARVYSVDQEKVKACGSLKKIVFTSFYLELGN